MTQQEVHTTDRTASPDQLIKGATGEWEIIVGMEVHAQVTSNAKLFSGASTAFGGAPNSHVSLVDAAMPGMLPVINGACVAQAVRTGLGLKAKINLKSRFDRKNYFYPDLPQGYQISQYHEPVVGQGSVAVDPEEGESYVVGIERLHLEQDAGKSIHDQDPRLSLVDLNRSGVALMEIVSKPDIRSADEAKAFLTKLRSILRYLGTCDGDMEKGSLRADVNVSIRRPGGPLGTRCEIKNLNSIRFVGQAVTYEARRQIAIVEDGGEVLQETRLFDPDRGETRAMRSKEEAHDYRYFPDPDLLPLSLEQAFVDELAATLPELPDDRKARLISQYELPARDAAVLVAEKETAEYFEVVAANRDAKIAANWVINELGGQLNRDGLTISQSPVSATQPGEAPGPHACGHDLRQDGQGAVQHHVGRGWRSSRHRRAPRYAPGHRHGRHREPGRRGNRRQPRQGRSGEGQAEHARLVRRPGHEGERRQGQSACGQRSTEGQIGSLTAAKRLFEGEHVNIGRFLAVGNRGSSQRGVGVEVVDANEAALAFPQSGHFVPSRGSCLVGKGPPACDVDSQYGVEPEHLAVRIARHLGHKQTVANILEPQLVLFLPIRDEVGLAKANCDREVSIALYPKENFRKGCGRVFVVDQRSFAGKTAGEAKRQADGEDLSSTDEHNDRSLPPVAIIV